MATVKAGGYAKVATSAQVGQALINRSVWECTVQAAADKVLIGKLPAGHRLVPQLCTLFFNASIPAVNVDLCVGSDSNTLINDQAVTASTATLASPAATAATHALLETIGVDFNADRDIYLLINSGAATAPAGSKVIATIGSIAVSNPD